MKYPISVDRILFQIWMMLLEFQKSINVSLLIIIPFYPTTCLRIQVWICFNNLKNYLKK